MTAFDTLNPGFHNTDYDLLFAAHCLFSRLRILDSRAVTDLTNKLRSVATSYSSPNEISLGEIYWDAEAHQDYDALDGGSAVYGGAVYVALEAIKAVAQRRYNDGLTLAREAVVRKLAEELGETDLPSNIREVACWEKYGQSVLAGELDWQNFVWGWALDVAEGNQGLSGEAL